MRISEWEGEGRSEENPKRQCRAPRRKTGFVLMRIIARHMVAVGPLHYPLDIPILSIDLLRPAIILGVEATVTPDSRIVAAYTPLPRLAVFDKKPPPPLAPGSRGVWLPARPEG